MRLLSHFSVFPQINEFPNYITHQLFKDHTEPQMHQALCQTLPANWGSFFSIKQEHMCARDRGKADQTRCSLAYNLLKCWNRINFLLSFYPVLGGHLPSTTWCAGPCCLPVSWGPLLRRKNLGENEK